jgi:hypothetical protein
MKRQPKHADILDWEELADAPNTRGAFSFLRPQGSVIDIEQHRSQERWPQSVADELPSIENRSAKLASNSRPYRVHRCYRAQDGHSNGENQLYSALWQAGLTETTETKRVTMGWDRMASAAGMSDKAAQRNLRTLLEKLAVEVIAKENSSTRTGKTYRVFSYKAILERRRAAGMIFVTKDKGVRFVTTPEDINRNADAALDHPAIDKTSTVDITTTVDKTSTGTVDKTSPPLGSILGIKNRKTTTTGEDLDPIVATLAKYVVADESAAQKILSSCREACATATVEEIASVIALKAPGILRNRSINNPLGLLITSVPQCFHGVGIDRLRAEWADERLREIERQQERERQELEMVRLLERQCQKCRDILNRETATEKERSKARDELSSLEELLPHDSQADSAAIDQCAEFADPS